ITRNIFYRNLIDPYHWSWQHGNSRWDLLNVLRTYYALRPQGINWPRNKNNLVTFKLNEITRANGIKHINAHDATADVYATIELMKFLQHKQPRLLNFLFKNRIKNRILHLINVTDMKPIFYISSSFGTCRYNISLISPIMWHPNNSNILISIDLTKDLSLLENININNIFNMGIKLIYMNRCPIFIPYNFIQKIELLRLGINDKICHNNFLLLKKSYFIKEKIKLILHSYSYIKSNNVDLQIYDSFFCKTDQQYIEKIHKAFSMLYFSNTYTLHDSRIKDIIFRCKSRNFIAFLNKNEKKLWFQHCIKIFNSIDFKNYKCNIQYLIKKHINNQKNIFLLKQLLSYIKYLENSISCIL
ncbi:MAG TPA: exodeoxyribonuclease I, partial [Buchnera sp. (in: enterobacteria)]|nr:exodeoxyribonuclease I [Buchnera sp. (in: enterobacteria)]